ncbi:MAG: LytTR family DNA-binding domain-containing protein, partial [Bacteroidota bacterium]
TSHTDFALEAYELDVIDYLIKPVKYARFLKTITKIATARKETNAPVNQDFFIKVDNKYIRLSESDILFIEGLKDYVMIHTEQDRKYITYATLKYIEEELRNLYQDRFMRIHRSFIINTRKIDFVEETQVYIKNTIISIGATYKQQFFNMMNKL